MDKERLTRSLKGGDSEIRLIKLRIDEKALVERTFTLQVTAQFRSRSQEMIETVNASLPVRLYPAEEFKALANPYVYANSGLSRILLCSSVGTSHFQHHHHDSDIASVQLLRNLRPEAFGEDIDPDTLNAVSQTILLPS